MPDLDVAALLERHGSHLLAWQREMFVTLLSNVGKSQIVHRGRRAGWTVLLQAVEAALKDRERDDNILWDGSLLGDEPGYGGPRAQP